MKVIIQLWWLLLWLWIWIASAEGVSTAKPNCTEKCGNISIPYPFGIEDPPCSMNESFLLKCKFSKSDSSYKLILGELQVLNISIEEGTATISSYVPYYCYNMDWFSTMNLRGTPFTFSATENRFTAIGCDTIAELEDYDGARFGSGCTSFCYQPVNLTADGSCSGIGCCQTRIPKGVKDLNITIRNNKYNYRYVLNFSRCSYAFLARQDWLGFSTIDLNDTTEVKRESPAVLDWTVGEEDCDSNYPSSPSSVSYACGPNTNCVNSNNGPGYRCVCKPGYRGNPYLSQTQGCQVCAMGIFLSFIIIISWIGYKRRNKRRNFQQNGGRLLKHQKIRIFSEDELEKATEKYDNGRLLGRGGFGAVYKGVLTDGSEVAVKKPNEVDKTKLKDFQREVINEEFQHEISIVTQVNHKNVVKLIGLCLETNFPLLIYEFISNGSLFDHLHVKHSTMLKSWANCLRIAAETSLALDYLHSLADPPIIHRDVKSMNILLDEKFTAKVSDFGASVLIPFGQSVVATKIQGTQGYLDPEYLITGILTAKSDVYSFGVVLMELLTGQMPIPKQRRSEENVNFIQDFISSVECKSFSQILMNYEEVDSRESKQIGAVAELAVKCLGRNGTERPTMKDVAEQLNGLNKLHETFQAQEYDEETESLLGNQNDAMVHSRSESHMSAFDIELS